MLTLLSVFGRTTFTWGAGRSTTRHANSPHGLPIQLTFCTQDDYRLPEGIKRIGYDADTASYYFRDREGLVYKGPEGSEFGEMTQGICLPLVYQMPFLT